VALKVLAVVGTRPEAIKMAPVVAEGRRRGLDIRVCATAQHREMLDQVLEIFAIVPEHDLDLMRPDQSLADLASRELAAFDRVLVEERPDWVLVQGDTTTAMIAGLAAFYRAIPVGHVEAGLRTGDLARPFPEELNRRVIDMLARAHFVPTAGAKRNLVAEGIPEASLHVTGNTVVDALRATLGLERGESDATGLPVVPGGGRLPGGRRGANRAEGERLVLVTAHRRESFGEGMRGIARALARIAAAFPDVRIVYPVHPNPNVRGPMEELLGGNPRIHLATPLPYLPFVTLMANAHLIMSDSGGVQEEAPALGVPALVLRETTERPEAIEAGAVELVGVDEERIVAAATAVLADPAKHARMARAVNPYGDGRAAERIVSILTGEPWSPFTPGGGD
jgi:UDP-N-acetylglucosamine 2-epimerase (non-hydrolysing)